MISSPVSQLAAKTHRKVFLRTQLMECSERFRSSFGAAEMCRRIAGARKRPASRNAFRASALYQIRIRGGRNCGAGSCGAKPLTPIQSRKSEYSGKLRLEIVTSMAAELHPVWQLHGHECPFSPLPWRVSAAATVMRPTDAVVEMMLTPGLSLWRALTDVLCPPCIPCSIPGGQA